VQATIRLSRAGTLDEFKRIIEGRIRALANVQALFVESRWVGADLATIARQELAPYLSDGEKRASIDGPSVVLAPPLAQAVAVLLHELTTNAAKYGALSVTKGRVESTWESGPGGGLLLRWRESGGPRVTTPESSGFGTQIIDRVLRGLDGNVRREWHPDGLLCEISLQV
jgi:two-component sensor histidine kinase